MCEGVIHYTMRRGVNMMSIHIRGADQACETLCFDDMFS